MTNFNIFQKCVFIKRRKHFLIESMFTASFFIYSYLTQRVPPQYCTKFSQSLSKCNCSRSISRETNQIYLNTTCSDEGAQHQPNQNVVSFSLYFCNPMDQKLVNFYNEGILLNLESMRQHYPNYSMRIYTDTTLDNSSAMCHVYCQSDDLFWCDVRKTPGYGHVSQMYFMTWRFLPLGDPSVDTFLSRDLGSVISPREAAVVQDWLQLKPPKPIHVMRDKQGSHDTPILGGMWGARNSLLGNTSVNLQQKIIRKDGNKEYTMVRPFPRQRKNERDRVTDFVGNPGFRKSVYAFPPCPMECKPSYGKNWTYC